MRLPQDIQLPELLGLITDIAPTVHIRLALTPDGTTPVTNPRWIARSLVVDVYPTVWVTHQHEGPLAEHPARQELLDFPSKALFYAGYQPTQSIVNWFGSPADCKLEGYDRLDGHGSKVRHFHLPALQDTAHQYHVFSGLRDNFARLPWPHHNFEFDLKGSNFNYAGDQDSLYISGHHYDDFREARGRFIHELTDLSSYQDRNQVMIRLVDADGWIRSAHLRGRRLKVVVEGLKLYQKAQVILKGTGMHNDPDNTRDIRETGPVDFTLKSAPPPDLQVVLANEESGDLDRARCPQSQYRGLFDMSAPHFVVEEDEPDTPHVAPIGDVAGCVAPAIPASTEVKTKPRRSRRPAKATPAKTPSNTVRLLSVKVASPGDVQQERDSLETVINELNRIVARHLGVRLELKRWETDSYPGFNENGPQGQIDQSMHFEDADIVIGIFWKRFGTPVADAQSGTEHELKRAYAAWKKTGRPHIMVYFNDEPYSPKSTSELDQWRAVVAFKEQFPPEGLWHSYPNSVAFPGIVRQHLAQLLGEWYGSKR